MSNELIVYTEPCYVLKASHLDVCFIIFVNTLLQVSNRFSNLNWLHFYRKISEAPFLNLTGSVWARHTHRAGVSSGSNGRRRSLRWSQNSCRPPAVRRKKLQTASGWSPTASLVQTARVKSRRTRDATTWSVQRYGGMNYCFSLNVFDYFILDTVQFL